jgi:hypothetical protein
VKLTKDEVLAALRLRYDHYSAQTMYDLARTRAGLADTPAYDPGEIAAFRAALSKVGDRLAAVDQRLDALLHVTDVAQAASAIAAQVRAVVEPAKAVVEAASQPAVVAPPPPKPVENPTSPKSAEAPKPAVAAPQKSVVEAPKSAEPSPTHSPSSHPADQAAVARPTTIALAGVPSVEGEHILMCGGAPELGDWDPTRAQPMARDGEKWLASVELPAGADVPFKFLRRTDDGTVTWEDGEDRRLIAQAHVDATWR